jgi:phosphotransferase system HPr (HPr) family protein
VIRSLRARKKLFFAAPQPTIEKRKKMSKKITLHNEPGLPVWALTDLVNIAREFHCHISLHDDEIKIDGKKLLQVISLIRPDLSKVEVGFQGIDEEEAVKAIRDSNLGRFIAQSTPAPEERKIQLKTEVLHEL